MIKIKKNAFTLAEMLLVIGLIGIVATLTIPPILNNTEDREAVSSVRKAYASLKEAHMRAIAVYGPLENWSSGALKTNDLYANRLLEFLTVIKDCVTDSTKTCYTGKLSGGTILGGGQASLILADGTSIRFDMTDTVTTESLLSATINKRGRIIVDLDGHAKGTNVVGKDVFYFYILEDGSFVANSPKLYNAGYNNPCVKDTVGYVAAEAWIVEKGNMDYLKTSNCTTCPDGTTLTWNDQIRCK